MPMKLATAAEQTTGLLAWTRAILAAAAMIAAGSVAWAVLTSRVEAAEAALQAHGAELQQHARSIAELRQANRDLAWNIYVVCTLQAQQLGIPGDSCRRPPETR